MPSNLTHIPPDENEQALYYRLSDPDGHSYDSTTLEDEEESGWLKPNLDNRTRLSLPRSHTRSISLVSDKAEPTKSVHPQQSQVAGAVLQVDGVSVKCELQVDARNVQVQLPRALFPETISWGQPIWLKMIEVDGIRQPIITIRQADAEKFKGLKAEIDDILGEF